MVEPSHLLAWAAWGAGSLRGWLRWASQHTGLPVIVVAAVALVGSWHVFKRTARFAVEVVVAAVLLLAATRLGLLRW
jgi:hypothetical protein